MRSETKLNLLLAGILGALLGFAGIGMMTTGLALQGISLLRAAALCLLAALSGSLLGRVRGGIWIFVAMVPLAGCILVFHSEAAQQYMRLLSRITRYYDNAYGIGQLFPEADLRGPMGTPVYILGIWISWLVSYGFSRGTCGWEGPIVAAVPLALCVVVTDTVPEPIWLYLWLLAMAVLLISRESRRRGEGAGNRAVLLSCIPLVLALGLLFWAFPRQSYDRYGRDFQRKASDYLENLFFEELPELWYDLTSEESSNIVSPVKSRQVHLENQGPRPDWGYPVMEVTAPVTGAVYLRGSHYDTYTGTGWTAAEGERVVFESPRMTREMGTITISLRSVRNVLYLPYYPDCSLELLEGGVYNHQNEKSYAFTMRSLAGKWRNILETASISGESTGFPADRRENGNLQLPEDTYAWASALAGEILSGEDYATAAADAIGKYVRNTAPYDLDTPRMGREAEDFARWFLEESDTGYCVHFATAAVVLLRAAGVEARYVEGYMLQGVKDEPVTVTSDQAHAWAEYYEPLLDAWIVLEATPADLNEAETQPVPSMPTQTSEPQTKPSTPTTAPSQPEDTAPEASEETPGDPRQPEKQAPDLRWLLWVLVPAALMGTLEGQRYLRIRRRVRTQTGGSLNRRALSCWQEAEHICRLLKQPPPEELTNLAEKAKYSRRGISAAELKIMTEQLAILRGELQDRAWYQYLPDRYYHALR